MLEEALPLDGAISPREDSTEPQRKSSPVAGSLNSDSRVWVALVATRGVHCVALVTTCGEGEVTLDVT